MERVVEFSVNEIEKIKFDTYDSNEFAIARMGFLSTRPNSHGLEISEEVLRNYAPTVLGKWVVAKMFNGDATTHLPDEHIMGNIPRDQEVEFVYDDDGYLRAYVDTVISKIYAKEYCNIFEQDNERAVSVEMKIDTENGDNTNDIVNAFNIVGVTTLGKTVNPSCPQSDIKFIRFAEEEACNYFEQIHKDSLASLKRFAKEIKEQMAAKSYKVDKSKEALSTADWGSIDKASMRDKIMEADNRASLVKQVYLLVEEGWEDAPSEHLKYPVMELKDDTFVYNREALSSALAYAKQHNETSVVNKVEKIYKSLDLELPGKEETKMSEIEFAAVNIGDMWGKLYEAMRDVHRHWDYYIRDIYEQDNQKFAIVYDDAHKLYRLDFSLTEEGLTLADEIIEVKEEFVETENMVKFAQPEDIEKYQKIETEAKLEEVKEEEPKPNAEELMAKITKLEADVADRDNIIMEKDAELAELRNFKAQCEEAEKMATVNTLMSKYDKYMDRETADAFMEEGKVCKFAEIDAWANRVKASVADEIIKKSDKPNNDFTRMSAPVDMAQKHKSLWED